MEDKETRRRTGWEDTKTCKKCNFEGDKTKHFVRAKIKNLWQYGDCKKCHQKYTRAWRYGLNVDQLDSLLEKNTHCNICEKEFTKDQYATKDRKVIDHCHTNGYIRGVLCDPCNTTLGQLERTPSMLKDMINYLKITNNEIK